MAGSHRLGSGFAGQRRVVSLLLASVLLAAGLVMAPVRAAASPGVPLPAASPTQLAPANAYESFVQATYHDFMDRLPNNQDLSMWSTAFADGRGSMEQYLRWMSTSDEWLGALLTKMYQDTLQRDPDPTGLYGWKRALGPSGQYTVAQVASFFYASDEYYTLHAGDSPSSFVTSLYQKLLNRDPDPLGLAYWVDQTNNPQFGRTWVAYNFYQSDESRADRVTALYQMLLARGPDPVGLAFWKVQVLSTGDLVLATQIAGSQEYWEKALVRYPSVIAEPVIVTDVLPGGTTGQAYTTTLEASGGVPPYTWWAGATSDGSVSVDPSTGVFSGTPHRYGTWSITIQLTDAAKRTVTKTITWPVLYGMVISTSSLPKASIGYPYTKTIGGYGGTAPYTWSATGLPAGLSLDSATGAISGTPTAVGSSSVTVTMSDAATPAQTVQATLSLVVDPDRAASQISAAGTAHTCALTSVGGVKCWGFNSYGQLGDGTKISRTTPVDVDGLTSGVTAVAAGGWQTCAVTSAGGVKCWGYNSYGGLGDGTTTLRPAPVDVAGLSTGATAIAVGSRHACALTTAGTVKCWGLNSAGQLGDGTTTNRSTPVDVVGLSGVTAIAIGTTETCAVTSVGVRCWGYNASGQLGDGTTTNRSTPVDVVGLSGVTAIAIGSAHTCAVTSAGVHCWGSNANGQLGDGTTTDRLSAVDVAGLGSGVASAISAGGGSTCAVTSTGGAKCWGSNVSGKLGDGTTSDRATPVDVFGLRSGIMTISTGSSHSCAVTTGGRAECWGSNTYGGLGDNTTTSRSTPVDVNGIHGT